MELDDFKQRIHTKLSETGAIQSAHDLAGYIHARTSSTIKKIKRNIRFELMACTLFIAASIWMYAAYHVSYVRVFAFLSIVLSCLLLVYLVSLHKKISSYEKNAPAVRLALREIVEILERFTRLYFQFTMITLPIAFIFGLITGFLRLNGATPIMNFNWQRSIIFYAAWFIFWSVMMYYFSKWYIKKLYGNYLQQLKEQLRDIENG